VDVCQGDDGHFVIEDPAMTMTARRIFVLAAAPLLLASAMRPATEAEAGFAQRAHGEAKLELASLKAEARSLTLHIDGP
jgi:hypothetical protein